MCCIEEGAVARWISGSERRTSPGPRSCTYPKHKYEFICKISRETENNESQSETDLICYTGILAQRALKEGETPARGGVLVKYPCHSIYMVPSLMYLGTVQIMEIER